VRLLGCLPVVNARNPNDGQVPICRRQRVKIRDAIYNQVSNEERHDAGDAAIVVSLRGFLHFFAWGRLDGFAGRPRFRRTFRKSQIARHF
jgi:hypothetical protein